MRKGIAALYGMALVGMLILGGCGGIGSADGGGNNGAPAENGVNISLDVGSSEVTSGDTLAVTVKVLGSDNTAVIWAVDDVVNGNATVGTITGNGDTVTYNAPALEGTHVLAATSVLDSSKTATATVTVTDEQGWSGFGSLTTGGEGKPVVHVTNLNDSGPGSFRAALGSNRTIVFDVGGTISITSSNISVSGIQNLTVDGTSAPGPGVTFDQRGMWFRNSSNIVIRNVRYRGGYDAGPETGPNLTFFPNCTNVVLDRCSFSGFSDSGINLWSNIHEVTIMNCLVGPGMNESHNFPVLISEKCYNVTMLHTLIYGGDYRNPAVGWADNDNPDYPQAAPAIVADLVNNVIYKYGGYGTSIYWGGWANVRGNYYWSDSGGTAFEVGDAGGQNLARAYCSGNYNKNGGSITGNVGSPFAIPSHAQVTATSAADAAAYVKANAGCRVGGLDATDRAMINDLVF